MGRFHHILVPVDFEESSKQALDAALDLAVTFDAKLTLFHAWEMQPYAYDGVPYLPLSVAIAIEQAAKQRLASEFVAVLKRLPKAESCLVNGPAAFEILATTERLKVDLIVMGTHGRHGVNRLLFGSVAEKVVRASPVAVLTIRVASRENS